jgi:hypothetical protein
MELEYSRLLMSYVDPFYQVHAASISDISSESDDDSSLEIRHQYPLRRSPFNLGYDSSQR